MRETKFRGKTKEGKWRYDSLIKVANRCFILSTDRCSQEACIGMPTFLGCPIYEVLPETVGQYTGLKDKNGVEIYDGDIVKFIYNSTPPKKHIGVVDWNDRDCAWTFDNFLIEPTPRRTIEVIGNKHDNPELLKEK